MNKPEAKSRFDAQYTRENRPRKAWNKSSTLSMPSGNRGKPSSRANHMKDGPAYQPNTMMVATVGAMLTDQHSSNCSPTSKPG